MAGPAGPEAPASIRPKAPSGRADPKTQRASKITITVTKKTIFKSLAKRASLKDLSGGHERYSDKPAATEHHHAEQKYSKVRAKSGT
jgi:hypothetical protein